MTKRAPLFLLALVFGLVFFAACRKKTDLVAGIPPVSRDFAGMQQYMTQLAALPADQRATRLAHDYPHLQDQLVQSLRNRGKVANGQEVRSVQFVFGSQDRGKAEGGDGKTYDGFFKDQLVARVSIASQQKPLDVLVVCLNGTFSLPGDLAKAGFTDLGTRSVAQRFSIGRGEGLIPHVGHQLAIDIAAICRIPLFRGRGWNPENQITPAEARQMEATVDKVQVTVAVLAGDSFDLTANPFGCALVPSTARQRLVATDEQITLRRQMSTQQSAAPRHRARVKRLQAKSY